MFESPPLLPSFSPTHPPTYPSTPPAQYPLQAVNKLEEALEVLGLKAQLAVSAAMDLGAAPGAWTTYLAGLAK